MPSNHYLRITIILSMLVALGPMATDLYLPSFPAITKAFNVSSSEVQLTLSIYLIGFAMGQLIYGPLSDQFGRKPVLIVGLLIFVISSVMATLATSIEALIFIRLFQALGGCAGPVLGRSMVRDLYQPAESAIMLSHISTVMALAPAVAPIVGGYLTVYFGWEANFWFLFVYGLIALIVYIFNMSETINQKNPNALKLKQLFKNYFSIIKHREWLYYTLICAFAYSGLFVFLSGSSFVLIDFLEVAEEHFGYFFAVVIIGYMTGTQLTARLVKYYRSIVLIRIGCIIALTSGLIMFLLSIIGLYSVFSIIVPHFFFMASVGVIMPLTIAGALAPFPHMAGAASALFGMLQMLIAAILGGLVGFFHTGTPTIMATGIAFAGAMTFLIIIRLESFLQFYNKVIYKV